MDKDCLKSLIKNVDTQLFEIVNNLICSICQELLSKPVTTPCGHSFCNGCIKRVLSSKDNSGCPLCKNPVKRYGLKGDEVKSTLRDICQEIPVAFAKDVEELTNNLTDLGEDVLMSSKLSQLFNNEFVKQSKMSKQKSTANRKARLSNEKKRTETDSETFVPVLKRTKNVLEYASAKKKKMDDLVSISQTEPLSNSSLGDSELDKKLQKIEKILPEEKVCEWFNAVGDNIYINSPSSFPEIDSKNEEEGEKRDEKMPTMIRRDYHKPGPVAQDRVPIDPYEFIPSQNNKSVRKRPKRKSAGKKIPDFKALQSFSKESVKRNNILMDDSKEEICAADDTKDDPPEIQITASQKFDQLLSENNEQKKGHLLYNKASPSSSTKFLDCSFHSKIETVKKKKTPRARKKLPVEDVLFKTVELFSGGRSLRSKRLRSSEGATRGKKKKMMEVMEINNSSELNVSEESYLIKQSLEIHTPSTRLGELLKELLDDDVIYETRPLNAPVRLPDVTLPNSVVENQVDLTMQNTEMIGFCTHEETPDERDFKRMVENMEKELNSSEYLMELEREKEEREEKEDFAAEGLAEILGSKNDSFVNEERNDDGCDEAEETSKMSQVVEFLHLGRLTPIRRRAKSTVVKLVFPIGLTSLARRRAVQSKCAPLAPKKRTCQVSTGIQTSQHVVSSFVQTSQVPQTSVDMQTSQQVRPSVEVQTTQKSTTSANIQTSQLFVSQEIQTTQVESEFAQMQTAQMDQFCQNENSTPCETPARKPSHQHRKIIIRKESPELVSQSPKRTCTPEEQHVEKNFIKDFDGERVPEKPCLTKQNHQHLVEFKNKRNREKNENSVRYKPEDSDSEDSDVLPPKRRVSFRILSQDSSKASQDRQIPVDAGKLSQDEEMEVIDLETPRSQTSEEQMLRVLKNIELDLPKGKTAVRGEKSEESDSDIFVEQTPPKHPRAVEDNKNVSRSRAKQQKENERLENSEGNDFICDSLPKGFSESFLLPTAPQRIPLTPERNSKDEFPKRASKIETAVPIELPDENDQNQLNAFDGKAKAREMESRTAQLKAAVVAWKRTETSQVKIPSQKKVCVVASSVKSPDLIRKFVNRFKLDYQNKPTKDMTHLIVGLHENDDREVLPLCTPKLLFAMANKKWVVSENWAETCLKMNALLPADEFETLDPVGGNGCRKARLSGEKILKNCEIFMLGEFQMISKEEFADLISDCGGVVVPTPDKFSFLPSKLRMIIADKDCLKFNEKQLQDLYQKHSAVILSRDVIIMSIQSYKLVNFSSYMLHPVPEENLVKLGYPSPLVRSEEDEEDSHQKAVR